jgi:hypothetical protein
MYPGLGGLVLTESYRVLLYPFCGLPGAMYGIVGIASRWRFDRERVRMSDATSEPYCSANWLDKDKNKKY